MPVIQTLPRPIADTWYLAYGSNLSTQKFIDDRGITPLSAVAVIVPGWTLTIDSAGFPYSEPAFASISPIHHTGNKKAVELIGTAYKLDPDMYQKVLKSEGGGIAYAEIEVWAINMSEEDPNGIATSSTFAALLRMGADAAKFPLAYQKFLAGITEYHPSEKPMAKLGASLFLAFWRPVMSLMERITKASLKNRSTGYAPIWVIVMVRIVMVSMWFYHDFVHAPIWGRGDGMGSALVL
ncbi:hypothetical protein PFICI_09674 [Pestalotiopsis fici W106-1]|uniref:gamma-glutamylcyclotransferase n=1 Tax=Pestalotiopsis fici (strain W106-1 / CGMCC3.15140) TaxID=1229662 RepID=W3WWV3_PESFW|nr:uncharacterized protein PFICI_09674 [Pestalotiopsis fici W106-1]ETS77612.1 hypothetical protein PFICI_09674 [Pestalotiopsis fici W106-1]